MSIGIADHASLAYAVIEERPTDMVEPHAQNGCAQPHVPVFPAHVWHVLIITVQAFPYGPAVACTGIDVVPSQQSREIELRNEPLPAPSTKELSITVGDINVRMVVERSHGRSNPLCIQAIIGIEGDDILAG